MKYAGELFCPQEGKACIPTLPQALKQASVRVWVGGCGCPSVCACIRAQDLTLVVICGYTDTHECDECKHDM